MDGGWNGVCDMVGMMAHRPRKWAAAIGPTGSKPPPAGTPGEGHGIEHDAQGPIPVRVPAWDPLEFGIRHTFSSRPGVSIVFLKP